MSLKTRLIYHFCLALGLALGLAVASFFALVGDPEYLGLSHDDLRTPNLVVDYLYHILGVIFVFTIWPFFRANTLALYTQVLDIVAPERYTTSHDETTATLAAPYTVKTARKKAPTTFGPSDRT